LPKGIYKRTEEHKKHLYAKGKPTLYKCFNCGKVFQDTPSTHRKYCSRKCKELNHPRGKDHPNWKGGLKSYQCELCGKSFKRKPDSVKRVKHIFCSCKCQAIYKCKHQKKTSTNIERKMAFILSKTKVKFVEQFVVPNVCIADFYLPEQNMVIFCDGEYWHNYPKGKPRDKTQVKELKELGFSVVRIWGDVILHSPALEKEPLKYIEKFLDK